MAIDRLVWVSILTALLLSTIGAIACNDPTGNGAGEDTVIVSSGEAHGLVVLSGPDGGIVAMPAPTPRFQDAHALTPGGRALYFTAFDSIPTRALLTLSTSSFEITSKERLTDLESRSLVPGLSLIGNYGLAFSPDGARLLLADALRGGETGIAVIDVATQTPVSFIGPLSISLDGLASTPPTSSDPGGRIFAIGTRTPGVLPRADSLFDFDGATLVLLHVAAIAAPLSDGSSNLFAMQPSPNGRMVYMLGTGRLYAYDVSTRRVIAEAPAPRLGSIAVSPDGGTVYVTDPGDRRDVPGAGLVLVFGLSLEPRAPIDLRSESMEGVPPITEGVTVSADGRHLYILSGTASRGPLFGPQPRRVFIVDAAGGELVRSVALGDYGAGPVFVVR